MSDVDRNLDRVPKSVVAEVEGGVLAVKTESTRRSCPGCAE